MLACYTLKCTSTFQLYNITITAVMVILYNFTLLQTNFNHTNPSLGGTTI